MSLSQHISTTIRKMMPYLINYIDQFSNNSIEVDAITSVMHCRNAVENVPENYCYLIMTVF